MESDPKSSVFGDLDPLAEGAQADDSTPEAAEAADLDPLTQAQQEAALWRDRALRSAAELDNFRKRSAKDRMETIKFANGDLLERLLPMLDNFDFGLQAAKAESEKSTIYIGMNMVLKQIQDFLRDNGVVEIPAVGEKFDPNIHEAVSQQATKDVPEGTILSQVRRGYRLHDRLLRPASVVVAASPAEALANA